MLTSWGFMFLASVGTGAWSLYIAINLFTDGWSPRCTSDPAKLEYVSTRIAHCLDKRPSYVWSLVYALQVQILLLLSMWRRLFVSYHFVSKVRQCVISCGVWFIISFAMVVEFRNDRNGLTTDFLIFPAMQESTLHSYAAVNAMLSLTILHALLCSSLIALSTYERQIAREAAITKATTLKGVSVIDFDFHKNETAALTKDTSQQWDSFKTRVYEYATLDWVYLAFVIVFFYTWAVASTSTNVAVYETSVHTEWTVLLLGAVMQAYALWQSERPLVWNPDPPANIYVSAIENMRHCKASARTLLASASYVAALLYCLIIFGMAPLDMQKEHGGTYEQGHLQNARSSSMLLTTVVTTYAYAGILLLS